MAIAKMTLFCYSF